MQRIILSVVLLHLVTLTQQTAIAACCPFCDAPSLTIAEQVGQAGHLLFAKWLSGTPATNDSAGSTKFEILDVAKSQSDAFQVGQQVELPQHVLGTEKSTFILMGPDTQLIDWNVPVEASQSAWDYISKMPPSVTEEKDKIERLAYFLDFLQHPELIVSNDAYSEFAAAPYEIITPLKDRMPREKLRQWVMDPETPVTRLGLYGLLLGLCGKEDDAAAMQQKILLPETEFRLGIEGVMSGYLLIAGESGLKVIEDSKMRCKNYVNKEGKEVALPFSETYAAMQTLRFMWTYEPDRIPRQRLKESMRILLVRPELADLVIADLARWKDWDIQTPLMEMYDKEDFNIPSIKRAVVRYFFYCSTDVPEGTKEEDIPQYAVTAKEKLKLLEEKDPKTVRDAKRFLIR